jgi:hypothetical protein
MVTLFAALRVTRPREILPRIFESTNGFRTVALCGAGKLASFT